MSQLSIRLGFWSAFLSATTFIIFTVCFVAIAVTAPLFTWTNLADYVAYTQENNQIFKEVAQLMMLLFGPLLVILLSAIHEYAPSPKRILTRNSIAFGAAFALLIGINYFVQLTIVRQSVGHGHPEGLELFIQANPAALITAVNMLGWTLFLGLSCLFVAPIFSGGRLEKLIRVAFFLNGIFVLAGGVSYLFEITILVFLLMNFGMGGALTVATISLAVLFRRMKHTTDTAVAS